MTPALTPCRLPDGDLTVSWGRSGHCLGSVWYAITSKSEKLIYSGDYVESSLVYGVDPIRDVEAHMAILDCAYGSDATTAQAHLEALIVHIKTLLLKTDALLLPVPKYGRGLELLLLNDFFDE